MSAVLVTGAGGYLGGRVAQSLRAAGHSVRLVSRRARIAAELDLDAELVRVDSLIDVAELTEACRGIDVVLHLAAPHEVECARDPVGSIDVTVLGTWRLVEAAAAAGARRFVYFSTAHVYGAPLEGHLDERTPTRPVHPYAIGHRAAEDIVLAARDRFEATIALRLSNVVGAPARRGVDRWTLLANDLCRQAVEQGRLVLRTHGLQPRDFLPMADLLAVVEHAIGIDAALVRDGLLNVAAGQSRTVYGLAQRIAERAASALGARPTIERPEPPEGTEPGALSLDITRLRDTGFEPRASLDGAIDELLSYCLQERSARARSDVP